MEKIIKTYLILFITNLTFLLLFNVNSYPQDLKLKKRVMTDSEFKKFKDHVGTYEKGKNYNQIINGHGTGLVPPTEEEWGKMRNQPVLIDKIEYPIRKLSTPTSYDNSATIWFPPIGHQGGEGSCVAWACVYYVKTFQEAKEHNWDLSACLWEGDWGGNPSSNYQDKIFSPDFGYHLLNKGANNGIGYSDIINLLQQVGCCTWDKMPNDIVDHTEWPTENAWRQAPLYRSQTGYGGDYGFKWINSDSGIEDLKQLLANGNLAVISINANYFYENFTPDDLLNMDNYNTTSRGHSNTIVGYDDNFGPYMESGNSNIYGAFKVANSWGVGDWENIPDGFYYISYECMKQYIQYIYFYQNSEGYEPKMVAVFEINHNYRDENKIDFGIIDSFSSQVIKPLDNFSVKGGNLPYPNNPIVMDITELMSYMSGSSNQFFMKVDDKGSSTTGTIQYFSVEMYDNYAGGIPKNVYVSTETPINTQDWNITHNSTYVNVFTSPETITIIFPSEGEVLDIGSNPTIKYSSVGTSGYVTIDYSTDIGVTWNPIAENVVDNGEFKNWIVPNTPSGYCKLRISDTDGSPSVISKGLFRIGPYEFTEQTSISLDSACMGLWGDYDNDGNLDILLTWLDNNWEISKVYHNNGNNTFTEVALIHQSAAWGSAAWGDYDNDGDLDLLFSAKVYRNDGNNTFTEQKSISLIEIVGDASSAWGDYDNDGYLDILLTGLSTSVPHPEGGGAPVSRIYHNNRDNTFSDQISVSLIDATMGSVAWGDYDNDGNLDILLTGETNSGRMSKIYRNNGDNTFTEQTSISLTGVGSGSVVWGDYDNDGYLDILLTGASSGPTSKVYHNNSDNTFTEQTSIQLWNVWGGSVAWVDYDNDGYLDISLNGITPSKYNTKIYRNNGNNTFTEQTSIFLGNGRVAWGDYDNDGDLDILLNDSYLGINWTNIYRNNSSVQNIIPSTPSNLKATINGNDVTFSWDKSTDNETPQNGLTYNVVIGTSPGSCDILSPMADLSTGKRRIVSMGNAGHCNFKTIKGLANGQYYWSVQAIDNCFAGSGFAAEKSFTIPAETMPDITLQPVSQAVEEGETVSFKVEATCNGPLGFQWWNPLGGQWNDGDKNGRLSVVNTENSSTLTITNVNFAEDDSNKFLCEVKNLDNYPADGYWINSNTITLSVALPQFTEQTSISLEVRGPVSWGDYNNDGYLDILSIGHSYDCKIYRNNGNNTFTSPISISLNDTAVENAVWGDYDNDGDLDILLTGSGGSSRVSKIYRNDGNNSFTEQTSVSLIGVEYSSIDWGDYDNDGNLDILLTGDAAGLGRVTKVYWNNGDNTFTEQTSISLDGIFKGSAVWGDYDHDGNLDILLTGNMMSKIYRNNGDNTFTEQTSISLYGLKQSSAAWGDCDNDGDLDIILTGAIENIDNSYIYINNGDNSFTKPIGLIGSSSAAWGDYDNDGDLDIILSDAYYNDEFTSKILRNNGSNNFTNQFTIPFGAHWVVWGDYDNDGVLDLLLADGHDSKIYRNNNMKTDTLPSSPSNLKTIINGNDVTFSWDKSTDSETPQDGLTYNLVIGTSLSACDILSPMADLKTGKRRIVGMGNAGHCNSKTIKGLSNGEYYWSVQAIDNCFAGSPFAPVQTISVPLPVELTSFKASIKNIEVELNWETATEVNNYGFEIERKNISENIKEGDWIKIGFVHGHGTSNSTKKYSFIDKNFTGGTKFNYRLKQIDMDGKYEFSKEVEIELIPKEYFLYQNYPNPFNPETYFKFQIVSRGLVTLKIYDILGKEIATIVNEEHEPGFYQYKWNASGLASGVYFYRLQAGDFISTKKLLLMK